MNKFLDSSDDLIGRIALGLFCSSENIASNPEVSSALNSVSEDQVRQLRAAAEQFANHYVQNQLAAQIEKEKNAARSQAYREVIQQHFTDLARTTEDKIDLVRAELQDATSWSRQVVWAVVASFVFGVVLSLAQLVPSPFST